MKTLGPLESLLEARTQGDVAGGILVDEDVVEDEARTRDWACGVHEGHLAQTS